MSRLRWYIAGLLFLSTVINYIDRQTFSVLGPYLQKEFGWTNSDFALAIIAFRIAYSLGQSGAGPLLDRVGTRLGLTIAVAFYSTAAIATPLASGLASFSGFRFLLGLGESANWPGATKAVSEWFPRRESGWAVALFDSGSSVGAAIAPLLVLTLYGSFGSWRPVFVVTGALGFIWLAAFRWLYYRPEEHKRLSTTERDYILADRTSADAALEGPRAPYGTIVRLRQTWGVILGKTLTDPVWFFITDWFAIYLVARGFPLQESPLAFWVPFLAADAGNFLGGGLSSMLIKRGIPVGRARKIIVVLGGIGMTFLAPTIWITTLVPLTICFAVATCSYAAMSTMILNLPADLYDTRSVATVSGMSGTGAGLGTILATFLTGWVSDRYSFEPILLVASAIPLLAVAAILLLVRNDRATAQDLVRPI